MRFPLLNLAVISPLFFSQVALAEITRVPEAETGPFKVIFGLLIVLGLIAALAWAMKKMNHAKIGNQSVAKIVGGVSVGTRERVVVVEIGGRWIVVGVAAGQVTSLANFNLAELDFGAGSEGEPAFYEESPTSSAQPGRGEHRNATTEPRFQFKPELDESSSANSAEEFVKSSLGTNQKYKFSKENVKRILRKFL